MAKETEVKILNIKPAAVRATLKANKAKLVKNVLQRNISYKSDAHPDFVARIRLEGKNAFFALKGRAMHVKNMKVVDEYESAIDNPDAIADMLIVLGFKVVVVRELKREYYQFKDCSVEICTLPGYPTYIEIEGTPKAIDAAAKALGFTTKQYDARGIGEIFHPKPYLVFE